MQNKFYISFLTLLLLICFLINSGYSQVIIPSEEQQKIAEVDYSSPKNYEIGGITFTGNAQYDQRGLLFNVGDRIDIPSEKITETIKSLWNTGLFEN
jgi:outer membrane protein insertion porin family